ncbi:MAG: UDP-N-acetylmuramate dehydrogenase [Lachnospiraceae bacterium]|nr:UDP-N-acetylmuramate dehydrogenase [Lachnospiraceae bacterium]
MLSEQIIQAIGKHIPTDRILLNESMAAHTTFRVGGPADCLILVENREELENLLSLLRKTESPFFLLGNGSNLLVGDKGYDGIVIKLTGDFQSIRLGEMKASDGNSSLRAGAAVTLAALARKAMELGLTGLEFASGIPGTLGGGLVMNAGAYDGELGEIITYVEVLNESGEVMRLDHDTMEFGYRTSAIKKRPFIALEAEIQLPSGNPKEIQERMEELARKRKEKQPLEYPSAGSTFKRPEGNFAGKLIMDAGLRGFSIGGAQVSEKHCGFVVNKGNATAADIKEVIEEVRERVDTRFGVMLEPEVIMLGKF